MSTYSDGVADFLSCLSGLEQKNGLLFKFLSEKTKLPSVKPLLQKIGEDNEKHSKQLQEISEKIGNPKVKTKECKRKLSVVCENTEMILKQITKKETISVTELSDYLEILESAGGAAQYLLVQAETFLLMSREISKFYGMSGKEFSDFLNDMVREIEEHILLLEEIKSKIEQHQNKGKNKQPQFKYQTPDAWFMPSHSQKTGHVI